MPIAHKRSVLQRPDKMDRHDTWFCRPHTTDARSCIAGGGSPKQKGERALKPRYSTQASAAADGRDLDDEVDIEKGLPERSASKQPGKVTGDMKTISLSQVDAPTLAEFEVSHSAILSYILHAHT